MLLEWKSGCYKENSFLKLALRSSIYKSSVDDIKIAKTQITNIHRNCCKSIIKEYSFGFFFMWNLIIKYAHLSQVCRASACKHILQQHDTTKSVDYFRLRVFHRRRWIWSWYSSCLFLITGYIAWYLWEIIQKL